MLDAILDRMVAMELIVLSFLIAYSVIDSIVIMAKFDNLVASLTGTFIFAGILSYIFIKKYKEVM